MSGTPNPSDVAAALGLQARLSAARSEYVQASAAVEQLKKRCAELQGEIGRLSSSFAAIMDRMDVDTPGNSGWPARMEAFLAEVRSQLTRAAGGGA